MKLRQGKNKSFLRSWNVDGKSFIIERKEIIVLLI